MMIDNFLIRNVWFTDIGHTDQYQYDPLIEGSFTFEYMCNLLFKLLWEKKVK